MELQFDKEMDAILRKARVNQGVLVGDDPPEPKKHLDADTIAAFAENAMPPKAKLELNTSEFRGGCSNRWGRFFCCFGIGCSLVSQNISRA